jgi:putative ABC transport system permease protein
MTKLTLRGFATRKLRTVLTALAVILGVSMISGTYVLTDTINRAFTEVFDEAVKTTDVTVSGKSVSGLNDNGEPTPLDGTLVERIRGVEGVSAASGGIFSPVSLRTTSGDKIGGQGPPSFAASVSPKPFGVFVFDTGRAPTRAGEVGIDRSTARKQRLKVGDHIVVAGAPGAQRVQIVGIARFGRSDTLAGASVALMTLEEAQRVTGRKGEVDQIDVAGAPGTTPKELKAAVAAALHDVPVEVRTGAESAKKQASDIKDAFGFLNTMLLAFGAIALFVGAFVIYNTFSVTVAQRTRELALLRMLGASRGQVLRSVLLEAGVLGVGSAILGVLGGLLVAPALLGLFKAVGADLPQTGAVVATRTVVVSMIVGILVTLIAGIGPALKATRVTPITALRGSAIGPERHGHKRTIVASLFGVGGLGLVLAGLFAGASGGSTALMIGLGSFLLFLAVALFSPQLVRPLAAVIGWPMQRLGGTTGRLARENATRNPGRTAVTASALMIGLALVTFVSIFAAGFGATIEKVVDDRFGGDVTIAADDGFSPLPERVTADAGRLSDVAVASAVRFEGARVRGVAGRTNVSGIDPATVSRVYDVRWAKGSSAATLDRLRPGTVLAEQAWADKNGVSVGDRIELLTPVGRRVTYEVVGKLDEGGPGLLGDGLIAPEEALKRDFQSREVGFVFVEFKPGADVGTARKGLDRLLEQRFPMAISQDRQELKDSQTGQIDQLLYFIYALLALSVVISLLGIVNTLALSIHERTRELGMLRAIGTAKKQVRRMVWMEAAITSLIGAVLGAALGALLAILMSVPLADEGFALRIPWVTLVVLLVLAAIAGVVASIGPARRASRVDVLRALAYE